MSVTPDLEQLDRDALLALVRTHQQQHDEQLRRLEAELESHRQTLSKQLDELSLRSERIEHMKLIIEKLRHRIFGTKSEKIVLKLEQLEFQLEEQETTQAEAEAIAERAVPRKQRKAAGSGRKPLPEHLPREVVNHTPDGDCCTDCGGRLHKFGEDVSEQLEYVPDSFRVIRHVRPKFSCTGCDRVVEAPASSRPIERGLATAGMLAHVLVSKYSDHLPLYRQSEIYARQGVELSRSTLAGWVGSASDLLSPLVEAIQKHVLSGRKVHADDTPIPVLAPGQGKTKTGRLWTYVRDDRPGGLETSPAVWFAYSEDRKGEHPRQHLAHFKGALQADAYAGFHHLYGDDIYEAACWAHARRKFHEIHIVHPSPTTTEALARIGALYAIEEQIRGKPVEVRFSARQSQARPLLEDLRNWMDKARKTLSQKSETAGAIRYALSRWRALTRYCEDGLIEIDNSAAERALRAVALGRKNFLFAGSDCGGQRAAAMYTLIGSAKLNGLNPELYLRVVLDRIADHPIRDIDQLLPWNLAPTIQSHSSEAA